MKLKIDNNLSSYCKNILHLKVLTTLQGRQCAENDFAIGHRDFFVLNRLPHRARVVGFQGKEN